MKKVVVICGCDEKIEDLDRLCQHCMQYDLCMLCRFFDTNVSFQMSLLLLPWSASNLCFSHKKVFRIPVIADFHPRSMRKG